MVCIVKIILDICNLIELFSVNSISDSELI